MYPQTNAEDEFTDLEELAELAEMAGLSDQGEGSSSETKPKLVSSMEQESQ